MHRFKLIASLIASSLVLLAVGAAITYADDPPAPPNPNCMADDHGKPAGEVQEDTADEIVSAANDVTKEADTEEADDEQGDLQGVNDDSNEQGEDQDCDEDDGGDD